MKPLILHINARKPNSSQDLTPYENGEINKLKFLKIYKENLGWRKESVSIKFIKSNDVYQFWYKGDYTDFIKSNGDHVGGVSFLLECESFDDYLYYLDILYAVLVLATILGGYNKETEDKCLNHLSGVENFEFGDDIILRLIAPCNCNNGGGKIIIKLMAISTKFDQYVRKNAKNLKCNVGMGGVLVEDQIELLKAGFRFRPYTSSVNDNDGEYTGSIDKYIASIDVFSGKTFSQEDNKAKRFNFGSLGDYDKLLNYLIDKKDKDFIKFLDDGMKNYQNEFWFLHNNNAFEFQIKKFKETCKKLNIIPKISRKEFLSFLERGDVDMVKIALDNKMVVLSSSDSNLLFESCQMGYTEIVKLLLKNKNIDPNYKNCKSLIYAAYYDYVDIVRLLLSDPRVSFDSNKVLKYAEDKSKKIIKKYLKTKI